MTDLYALGVVTFEMVTGRLPFTGTSPVDLLMKHVEARPPRPSEFVPDLPPALDAFILQMLTKDPEARPNSADPLRQQLNKLRRSLRATRSNPSALSPMHEKPRVSDDASSRRPTTPVAVPPELSPQVPEKASAPTPLPPPRKHLPIAIAMGAGALMLAGAVALVFREPARAVPLTGPRESPPIVEAQAEPPAPRPTPPPPAPVDRGEAVAVLAGSKELPSTELPAPEDEQPESAPAPKERPSTVEKLGGGALAHEDTSSKETGSQARTISAPKRAEGRDSSEKRQLLKRIDALIEATPDLIAQDRVTSPDTMLKMLEKTRTEVELSSDTEEQRQLSRKFDGLKKMFLKR